MFRPVKILSETRSEIRIFYSLEEATQFLLMSWPAYQSPTLDHARQTCLDAIEKKVPRQKARAAFVAAAKEAGIHVGRTKIKKAMDTLVEAVSAPPMNSGELQAKMLYSPPKDASPTGETHDEQNRKLAS
ncbi:DUF982 domain-containing protein [Phyllobacterium sp. K27]